jgi:2-polyprenyl-3-methyl-5-hydroxy-6-metoxy-1,4-benzoquinol methylase
MAPNTIIPKNIHFITGLDYDFGGKPFGFINYMAIRSAMELNPDFTAYVYYQFEPTGPYWDLVKNDVIAVPVEAPTEIFGRPIVHFAHKADVLRLQFLLRAGGIYLDLDTICQKSFGPLMNANVVMGIESKKPGVEQWRNGDPVGLCNALIMAPQGSEFLQIWFDTYKDFDANNWNNHSVLKPAELARLYPGMIDIEPPESFFWPLWTDDGLCELFEKNVEYPLAYSIHLWESRSWKYVKDIDATKVMNTDTSYNVIARRFLDRDVEKLLSISKSIVRDYARESRAVFSDIYANNRWGYGSGSGSAPAQNLEYRLFLEKFLILNNIKSVLDFGCGDWQFSRYINWGSADYTGVDVVSSVIERNRTMFETETIKFIEFTDLESLPNVDLVLCKDVLQHISNEMCFQYIKSLKKVGKILLVTNDIWPIDHVNMKIETGGWRAIRLDLAPFNLRTASVLSWDVFDVAGAHRKSTYILYGDDG